MAPSRERQVKTQKPVLGDGFRFVPIENNTWQRVLFNLYSKDIFQKSFKRTIRIFFNIV
jgi:hypothetical protein